MTQLHTRGNTAQLKNQWMQELGRQGEAFVAGYYRDRGYRIIDMNVRYRCGEIDVIAQDVDNTVVFIEVKTRTTNDFGGVESVDHRKLRKLRAAATEWLRSRPWVECRFDVVALTVMGHHVGLGGEKHWLFNVDSYQGVECGAA
ncbi:putative endonuclease [Corynebacterium renale]|uniref:UPF0102 protein ATK06_1604 n=1 Tax=Corynebacterium renale TaxID=1724 RepID=A0A2A9DPI2_9CORY|nr:YraN family protein [Corynebacterium renale]PFG28493.1 putative endonuclease [Corynebacterium renale]SQG64912.1 putative endonuclease [Corynebacterium renale]SQI26315.1 putative endonuclease [Corynebacterium renale]STC96690.1 putative endonuclease [Corynebacterium renale]